MFARLFQNLRFGLRLLLAKPGFTFIVVLTLALGIGANTLVFTLIDGVYLSPLPYRDAGQLVDVYASYTKQGGGVDAVSIPDYVDQRTAIPALADSALYTDASFNLVDGGAPERLRGLRTTASLFSTLGVIATLGRAFDANEAVAGHDRVVVLTDSLWRNRFNADAQIVGRDLHLDGESYRVIGVMPPAFMFPNADVQFLVPFTFSTDDLSDDQRFVNYSAIVARLAPGATTAQVEAQYAAMVRHNVERLGAADSSGSYASAVDSFGLRFGARSLREQLSGNNASELLVLQAAVALVLLIACANVANLLLTRLTARYGELAVRTALGASRVSIVRQLLAESALLAFAGGLLGYGIAWFGVKLVASSGLLPGWVVFAVDRRVLAFLFGISALASFVFGLLPAFSVITLRPQTLLRESGRFGGGGQGVHPVRRTLAIVQIALAVALLAGAGLLLRSFSNAAQQSPGFVSSNVLIAALTLPPAKYPDAAAQARDLRAILDAVRNVPGVTAAGATTVMPFTGSNAGITFLIEGRGATGSQPHAARRSVDEDYFKTMGIPLMRGRAFTRADWETQTKSIIIDDVFEHKYFSDRDPIGQRIFLGSGSDESEPYTIIGVVGGVKNFDLTAQGSRETFYFNLAVRPQSNVYLALHVADAAVVPAETLRAAVRSVDPEQPLFNIGSLDQRIHFSLTGRRVPLQLLGLFAVVALLLAAIGIYGVLAFSVAQRSSEIGVRLALGATGSRVLYLVLADGGRLIGSGLALGLLCAIALGRLLRSQLFGVDSIDPLSLLAVMLAFALIGLLACYLPARRAAGVDPIEALRHE
ncbi:MAG: ABC transporter permease [Rudaea sp.]|nr:ABC transporter permease [Rudaea sp.]